MLKIREMGYVYRIYKVSKMNPLVQGLAWGNIRNDLCCDFMEGKIRDKFFDLLYCPTFDEVWKKLQEKGAK